MAFLFIELAFLQTQKYEEFRSYTIEPPPWTESYWEIEDNWRVWTPYLLKFRYGILKLKRNRISFVYIDITPAYTIPEIPTGVYSSIKKPGFQAGFLVCRLTQKSKGSVFT